MIGRGLKGKGPLAGSCEYGNELNMFHHPWINQIHNSGQNMLVRKLWIKYTINIGVHFVGYLYILLMNLRGMWNATTFLLAKPILKVGCDSRS